MGSDFRENGMKETDLGSLPSEWEVASFGDAVAFQSGQVDPREAPYSEMIHIGPENVAEASGELLECKTAKDLHLISGKYLFTTKDVVYSKIRPYLRKVALPTFDGLCSADMYPLRPKDSTLDREFLYFWLLSDPFTDQALPHQARTGIPKINRQQLQTTKIVKPSVPEQRAIARVLRVVQQAKEATQSIITAARELKRSLARHLFTFGAVPVQEAEQVALNQTENGQVPAHWPTSQLVGLLREPLRNGHSANATNTDEGIRTLTLTAVTRSDFSVENTKLTDADRERVKNMWLKSGDIFIERANTPELVGLAALYEGPEDFAIFPDLLVRVRPKVTDIIPKFLAEYLLTDQCRTYFRSNAKATAGNFPKIDQGIIEATTVPVPPIGEQTEIVRSLRSVDEKIRTESSRLNALEALFKTLLNRSMTGQVRVAGLKPT